MRPCWNGAEVTPAQQRRQLCTIATPRRVQARVARAALQLPRRCAHASVRLTVASVEAAACAMARRSVPQISGSAPSRHGRRELVRAAANAHAHGALGMPARWCQRYGKSHQPGLCRTHGINLIDFSHFHFIRIIMDKGINYSLDSCSLIGITYYIILTLMICKSSMR